MKMAKSGHFCILLDTPTPRRISARLGVELRLGEPEPEVFVFSGSPRRSNASPRRSIASPRRTYKSYFSSPLSLILTFINWINEDPNK